MGQNMGTIRDAVFVLESPRFELGGDAELFFDIFRLSARPIVDVASFSPS